MTHQPPYPGQPSYDAGQRAAQRGPRPGPVDLAVKLIWVGIALSLLAAIATFATLDTAVDQALQDAGVSQDVDTGAIRAGAIAGAVIGLIISVGLNALLAVFIGKGRNWARIVFTVLAVLGIVFSLVGLLGGASQPVLPLVLGLVQMLLSVVVLVLLWKPESSAWFSARA